MWARYSNPAQQPKSRPSLPSLPSLQQLPQHGQARDVRVSLPSANIPSIHTLPCNPSPATSSIYSKIPIHTLLSNPFPPTPSVISNMPITQPQEQTSTNVVEHKPGHDLPLPITPSVSINQRAWSESEIEREEGGNTQDRDSSEDDLSTPQYQTSNIGKRAITQSRFPPKFCIAQY